MSYPAMRTVAACVPSPFVLALLRAWHGVPAGAYHATTAEGLMRASNPSALIAEDGANVVMIEDVTDPDQRMYRLEYRATPDGRRAIAYCLFNPWGGVGNPSAGSVYEVSHVGADGLICVGVGTTHDLANSPFSLAFVLARARFWCTAFSVFRETGAFPSV